MKNDKMIENVLIGRCHGKRLHVDGRTILT
jgi:hypothetical protein